MPKSKKAGAVISEASPHTIKKFELIEAYVVAWAQKLLNYDKCNGIVFIDCMCNSGVYVDKDGNNVEGTPIRVSRVLADTIKSYPEKQALLYFNDLNVNKIAELEKHIPDDTSNFKICTSSKDGNELLGDFQNNRKLQFSYLLVYDPYEATIDWNALTPYFNLWGEVIINHMVSDTIRGVPAAKSPNAITKYEDTYETDIEELVNLKGDKNAFEKIIQEIISTRHLNTDKEYYIASFPFFNTQNALLYNLIHCSGNIKGFNLFKTTAWKTFGGKSSTKDTHGRENQMVLDLNGSCEAIMPIDERCYKIQDIAKYLSVIFKGKTDVPFAEVYGALEIHPVFPSEGFRPTIKKELKNSFDTDISQSTMTFR
jgi:three-Cys-motif partner protein